MESSTKILRRLLDERGVEWMPSVFDPQHETFYSTDNGVGFIVTEFPEIGRMSLACDMRITPEQAIAATLGSEGAYTREDVEGAFVSGYSLGSLPVGSDPRWDENSQTVDEHMAELGWVRAAKLGDIDATAMRQGDAAHDLMAPCDWRDGTLFLVLPEDPERIGVRLFPSRHAPSRMYVPMAEAAQIKDENAELQERVKEQGRTIRAYHNECDELREQMERLVTLLRVDCDIEASWDGLRKFWSIELTENGCLIRDRACKAEAENAKLRELAVGMYGMLEMFDKMFGNHDACETPRPLIFGYDKSFKDAMRELGVEVDW